MSRQVAAKYATHMISKLADKCRRVGRNLTLEAAYTQPSDELLNLWSHQVEMSEVLTERAREISNSEPHRAVMLVMAARLDATVTRNADTMYRTAEEFLENLRVVQRSLAAAGARRAAYGPVQTLIWQVETFTAEEFLENLRVVQRSLAAAGARRAAYGPVQTLIWQVETFGFHMVEMEFRQHSVVHSRALADIREHGIHGELAPMTRNGVPSALRGPQPRAGRYPRARYPRRARPHDARGARHVPCHRVHPFRQHSVVHSRALADIREHGIHGELAPMTREVLDTFRAIGSIQKRFGQKMARRYIISFTKSASHVADVYELLAPMTREVLDTFRAIGSIQKRFGQKMARRYIISFTKSASHVADVYELANLAFAHAEDVPTLDVIPLFEQLEDLEGCVDVLEEMLAIPAVQNRLAESGLAIPAVQNRLAESGRRMEIMLGYSDSSKDAGPTTATLALHSAEERIVAWCSATPTPPRTPAPLPPRSPCTPPRSASSRGPRSTISTWCSCTAAAAPSAAAAVPPTARCLPSPPARSTASSRLRSRAR